MKKLSVVLAGVILASSGLTSVEAIDVNRISGSDRYETSVKTSQNNFTKSDTAVIASGEVYPDALSSGVLASQYKAPLLLTKTNSVPKLILNELKRLGVKSVIIVGGEKSVSKNVALELSKLYKVERIAGKDRYETSLKIAKKLGLKEAIQVSGKDFKDALVNNPLAIKEGKNIILEKNKEEGLSSVEIAKRYFADSKKITLASGENFSDALSAVNLKQPILLTSDKEVYPYLKSRKDIEVDIIGGEGSVSNMIMYTVKNLDSKIEYSNLADKKSQEEVKKSLIAAGISEENVENFFKDVNFYNKAAGISSQGFIPLKGLKAKYDQVKISENWEKLSDEEFNRKANCRMTTFSLANDLIKIDGKLEKENRVLFMDQDMIPSSKNKAFKDLPKFNTFYGDLSTELVKDQNYQIEKVKKYWQEKKVSFKKSKAKIITVWMHSEIDNNLFVGHTGILVPDNKGWLFVEKLSFDEPYQAIKFENKEELKDYLIANYDVEYNQPTAKPFIMEDGKIFE